ncbi:MAG: hypothetical protein K2G55_10180 [Lachnospiraceae bacterium]|nr:hypothetical protein [Lachnospiraceae bacterium]MDE7202115.1 hypothetical protein [Lachnospiraceae bacterium]
MVKQNVIKHCLRLNMQNEQHQRIQRVLEGLNKDIHKSENQFIIKAVDFYIRSFEEDDIVEKQHRSRKPEYVTVEAIEGIRKELESSMKDELIRLLGTAITGGITVRAADSSNKCVQEEPEENNPYAAEAANRWG